jgi:O-antigen ligase
LTALAPPLPGPPPGRSRPKTRVLSWRRQDLRAHREAVRGTALALGYAAVLGAARFIDVSEDGKAMMAFSLLFLPALVVTAFARPLWFLLLVVAYLPFSKVYSLSLGGITGANMSNVILLLAPLAVLRRRAQQPERLRFGGLEALVLLFVLLGSVSALTAWPHADGMGEMLQRYRGWLAPILYFFIARGLVRNREGLQAVLRTLAAVAVLVGALTWFEGIQRGSRGSIEAARVEGLMRQANQMGAFLVYYGAATLAVGFSERGPLRYFFLGGYAIAARAMLFTFSRAAYLSLASGSTLIALLHNPLLLVAGGALGTVAVAVNPNLIPGSIRARFEQTNEGTGLEGENAQLDKSSAYRLILWTAGLRMVQEHPFVGVGLGRFSQVVGSYTDVTPSKNDPNDAHNAYLLVAAEMGVPAFLTMLALLLTLAAAAVRVYYRRGPPADRAAALAFVGCWGALLVSCMLGSRFGDEALISYFWILGALVAVARRLGEPRPRTRRHA